MSVKIKVSYTEYGELDLIIKGLSVVTGGVRVKEKPPKGRFKRAYIELNHARSPSEQRETHE